MKKIDIGVFSFLSDKRSLTSSKLYKIDIFLKDENLLIDLYFEFFFSNDRIKLSFSKIKAYSFYYNANYIFYNVELVKFFQSAQGFYISLDPVDESENISTEDQDYILSDKVEIFILTS